MPTIERLMPSYDRNEVHETVVRAPAARVMQAVREVTPEEILFLRPLMWLRTFGRRRPPSAGLREPERGTPLLDAAKGGDFVELHGTEREVVLGVIGRFWRPSGGRATFADLPSFEAFAEPGFAKALIDFRITDEGNGACRLRTETRIRGVDARARRLFKLYWFVIFPGSALIRRMWLRAVKQRAENGAYPIENPVSSTGTSGSGPK